MRIPLNGSLGERDFDGEFDALPKQGPPAADLSRARSFSQVRRRHHILAGGLLGAVLVAMGVAVWASSNPQVAVPASPVSTAPSAASAGVPTVTTGSRTGSCAGTVRLVSSGGPGVTLTPTSTPTLDVDLGDKVRLTSDGRCAEALNLEEDRSDLKLSPVEDQTATALIAGSTNVSVAHGMCAELRSPQPECFGGIIADGQATVIIHSR